MGNCVLELALCHFQCIYLFLTKHNAGRCPKNLRMREQRLNRQSLEIHTCENSTTPVPRTGYRVSNTNEENGEIMNELNFTRSATAPDTIVAPVAANIAWKMKSPKLCHCKTEVCVLPHLSPPSAFRSPIIPPHANQSAIIQSAG